ncbi:MAG: dienelactone hydrolase family protein [Candidatus Gastranaerophilales bacterium]|nr:dienelactone hydrolase family protein [Candidatus Gastranaerophilales bacterium]
MDYFKNIVHIPTDSVSMEGSLVIPDKASNIVLFVHGSGSSRFSPRNNYVADFLNEHGIATLLFDLLTQTEDLEYNTRFDIDLLNERLQVATRWVQNNPSTSMYNISYFGASTGAAAALMAAAKLGNVIKAIVSRGGRPDLAVPVLSQVKSPTMLIVGGDDKLVIDFNRFAYEKLQSEKEIVIIPGASHLFEETGTLEEVAKLAAQWFKKYL